MKTILDVSGIVYGGYYGSPDRRISGFPVGGLRKLLGIINSGIESSEFILCFDGGAEMKKELAPQYKAGRVPNYAVAAQIDLLKEILLDCDIPFCYKDGYEADDLICSHIHLFTQIGDPDPIVIYTDDRDLACCVGDNVKIKNVTSNGICINRQNYESRVVAGEHVPYNTILIHKMVYGDKSDNYKGIHATGVRFIDLATELSNKLQPYIAEGKLPSTSFMDLDVMNVILDEFTSIPSEEVKQALKIQAKLVFPQLIDVTNFGVDSFISDLSQCRKPLYRIEQKHLKVFGLSVYNKKKFDMYCNLLGLNRCRQDRYGDKHADEVEAFKAKLNLRAKELSTGVIAVERYNHGRVAQGQTVSTVENMALPI